MDGWSLFRKFSSKVKRRSTVKTPPIVTTPDTPAAASAAAMTSSTITVPETQTILLLYGPRQPYKLVDDYPVPQLQNETEVLVLNHTIGLNPIDWKAPDFNFAIPELPYISGRESAGQVCQVSPGTSSRLKPGDRVIAISTDYRDPRKAAYQQFVVTFDFNAVRLPPRISYEEGSTLGVAFVAASLALGICMGVDFSDVLDGPDLLKIVKSIDPEAIPEDVRAESLSGIAEHDRARSGEWLAIWGGSATSANLTVQLARLAGLKVATVVDSARHGLRLSNHASIRPDLLVDSHDPQRAIEILQTSIGDEVRFGIDTRGKDTAAHLLEALTSAAGTKENSPLSSSSSSAAAAAAAAAAATTARPPSPPSTPRTSPPTPSAHLIGLTGLPKSSGGAGGLTMHTVPIKLFHEVPAVGHALVTWLERLLEQGLVSPPEIIDIEEGLGNVNTGLDRMRRGEIRGGKLIVRLPEADAQFVKA